jgi:hypothetical protein
LASYGSKAFAVNLSAMTDAKPLDETRQPRSNDTEYFLKRADDHRAATERTSDPTTRDLQRQFEEIYRARHR